MKTNFLRSTLSISLIFVIVFGLTGCGTNHDDDKINSTYDMMVVRGKSNMLKGLENRRTEQSTQPITSGIRPYSNSDDTPASTMHVNEYLDYWPDVSNAIDQLHGIAVAYVFATNKNAYVGIMFSEDEHAQKTNKKGYDEFHRHEVAPRTIASYPYDHFYTAENSETNELIHDIGRIVNNYAAPRQVFISTNHDFLHQLANFVKLDKRELSLQPYLSEFNVLVQYYFAEGATEPTPINVK